jgi:SAM-dependent methyltransferase
MAGQPADAPLLSRGLSRRALLCGLPAAARARLDAARASPSRRADPAALWEAGDYRVLGRRLEPAAERLVRASAVGPGQRLLDIGAGDGNVALAAARAGAEVVAVDLAPRLVAAGRARAKAHGLAVEWRVGDAQSLPLEDAGFDCVASNFGIIHAPDIRRVVDELDRVLRPGGLALVTAWASAGFMGAVMRLAAEAERRGRDGPRPERWGRYETVHLAFSRFPGFEARETSLRWEFANADEVWDELTAPPGPLAAAVAEGGLPRDELRDRLLRLVEPLAHFEDDRLVLDVGYVLVLARKPEWAAAA